MAGAIGLAGDRRRSFHPAQPLDARCGHVAVVAQTATGCHHDHGRDHDHADLEGSRDHEMWNNDG
jgi:hypothetical protein